LEIEAEMANFEEEVAFDIYIGDRVVTSGIFSTW
jgi:hypothetical protein